MRRVAIAVNVLGALLFGGAAALQLNDPDPVPWFSVYIVAALICLGRAVRWRVRLAALGLLAIVVAWMTRLAPTALATFPPPGQLFATWTMVSAEVEEARELIGLLLVGLWMLVLALLPGKKGSARDLDRRDTLADANADTAIEVSPLGSRAHRPTARDITVPEMQRDTLVEKLDDLDSKNGRR